ncbi:MAG: ATP-binding cassette domain-containing protein [Lachnospiraceae bacterium]
MSQVKISNLTFSYEDSGEPVFDGVSFAFDTDWKLGLVGRNGKGKTTLANLLLGKYPYQGSIDTSGTVFDYFPYEAEDDEPRTASELAGIWKPQAEEWKIIRELNLMDADPEMLYRPFSTLSFGERMRVMLAVLFSVEGEFLIIDEPTNHLDVSARETVKNYLRSKKSFLLISHDRDLLDAVIDHILVMNRTTIEVQAGNFSSWWENKQRSDHFAESENEKHRKEISELKKAAQTAERWAQKNESTKIGFDPVQEHDRSISTRSFIGKKTQKMESRVKNFKVRMDREIQEKEGLLADVEKDAVLKMIPLEFHKKVLVSARDYSFQYDPEKPLISHLTFEIRQGDRVFLNGPNGCGKSTLIQRILAAAQKNGPEPVKAGKEGVGAGSEDSFGIGSGIMLGRESGELNVPAGLVISYVNQNTGFLRGTIQEFCEQRGLDETLFISILRQLAVERSQLEKRMEDFSEGQKKKVLLASSIMTPAHLYIWDEPLNYIDVFSRVQLENMILSCRPTMLIVEHDVRFRQNIATGSVDKFRNQG